MTLSTGHDSSATGNAALSGGCGCFASLPLFSEFWRWNWWRATPPAVPHASACGSDS